MGADFIWARAEMPDVPTIDGKGLYHDEAAKQVIFDRLAEALTISEGDEVNWSPLADIVENTLSSVMWRWEEENGRPWDWSDADCIADVRDEVVEIMTDELKAFWNGNYSRCMDVLETYNSKGERIYLTIAGGMSWGDTPEGCDLLWRFAELPEGWWKDA